MLLRRPNSLPVEDHLDMTPMVDVVFQLMTFLLITFQATVTAGVDLPEARSGLGVEESEAVILAVSAPEAPGSPARVYNGTNPNPDREIDGDEALRVVVQAALDEGRKHVVLQAAGDVPHGEVLRIAGLIGEVPGIVLHIGVEEPEN